MAEELSSPLATRILARASRWLVGQPETIAAAVGIREPTPIGATTIGDSPEAARQRRIEGWQRALSATDEASSRSSTYQQLMRALRVPENLRALNLLIDFAFGGSGSSMRGDYQPFEISYGPRISPEARAEIERVHHALDIPWLIPAMVRQGRWLGDSFIELAYNRVRLVGYRPLAPWTVTPEPSDLGAPSIYRIDADTQSSIGKGAARPVSAFQMLHYAPNRELGSAFGTSMFQSLRDPAVQFRAAIDVMFVSLMLGAGRRRTVIGEVPRDWTKRQIDEWAENIRTLNGGKSLFDSAGKWHPQIAALIEFDDKVLPYRTGTSAPAIVNEPPAAFDSILRVLEWMQGRFFLGSGVPLALAGLSKDVSNRGTLEVQALHFVKTLREVQSDGARLALDIYARALVVAEIPFELDDFAIRLPVLSEFNERLTAEIKRTQAEAALKLKELGAPRRWIADTVLRVPADQVDQWLLDSEEPESSEPPEPLPPDAAEEIVADVEEMRASVERLREDLDLMAPLVVRLSDLRA